ncbi:hypothetical protein [Streptomyces iranensis]|uniref:Uncharacterized protein n=1 Tax=Streptomyces iranensis TaxID=576784 RepID=A0A061A3N5_9ACTN|nr:hypothetical protein [Streptomyces iranensis]MBP2064299.1 hypothetical protein [Streptomyces iranensis]CDR17433.1 predicted protein [Streptomyces iranensis]
MDRACDAAHRSGGQEQPDWLAQIARGVAAAALDDAGLDLAAFADTSARLPDTAG